MQFLISDREAHDALSVCGLLLRSDGYLALRNVPAVAAVLDQYRKPTPRALATLGEIVERLVFEADQFGESLALQIPDDEDEQASFEVDLDPALVKAMVPIFDSISTMHREHAPECGEDVCFTIGVATLLDRMRMLTEPILDDIVTGESGG